MSVPPEPDDRWVRLPEGWWDQLSVMPVNGLPEIFLGDTLLPMGSRVQLHRAGAWHPARLVVTELMRVAIRVESSAWPGAPCELEPRDLEMVAARRA